MKIPRDKEYERKIALCRQDLSQRPEDRKTKNELANCLSGLGWCRYYEHKYEEALRLFREASELYHGLGYRYQEAKVLRGKGIIESILGMSEDAITTFRKADRILSNYRTGDVPKREVEELQAKTEYVLSIAYSKQENYLRALSLVKKAKVIFNRLNDKEYLSKCFQGEGIICSFLGRYAESNQFLKEAREIFQRMKDLRKAANIDENISTNLHHLGQDGEAIKLLDRAIDIYKELNAERSWAYFLRGRSYQTLEQREEAYRDYKKAVDLVERERGEIMTDAFRQSFFAQKLEIYDYGIGLCVDVGKTEEAYDLVCRAKARSFNELLEKRRDLREIKDSKLIACERKLRREIDSLYNKINSPEGESRIEPAQLKRKEKAYHKLLDRIAEENAQYGSLVTINPLSTGEIQKMIGKDSALIEYYCLKKNLLIFCLTDEGLKVVRVDEEKFSDLVENIRDCLHSIHSLKSQQKMNQLAWYLKHISSKFFIPVEEFIKEKKRLLFVPHRHLHYLPFGLLCNSKRENLISRYEISYLSSPQLLKISKEGGEKDKKQKRCLIVADPTGDLPYARREADTIVRILPGAKALIGEEASKETVVKQSPNYDILHFACHAKFNQEDPLFSHLVLIGEEEKRSRLEVNEIFNLRLKKTDLVVLSACESALGMPNPGDEITCLTRAFIYAGASSIIVTLWPIDDKATAELMGKLYKHLFSGKSKASALRYAQLAMMEKYNDPYLWAGFQLVGDYN